MTGRQFRVDRYGTFTDIVARRPHGRLLTHRLLSDNPGRCTDAAVAGVRTPLVITRDGLRIAHRNRPSIFAHRMELPEPLYERVVDVDERIAADGTVLLAPDPDALARPPSGPASLESETRGKPTRAAMSPTACSRSWWRWLCTHTTATARIPSSYTSCGWRLPVTVSTLSQHRRVPAYGMAGGEPDALGADRVEQADGTVSEPGGSHAADVVAGGVLVTETPGGGDYGSPSPDPHQAGEKIDDLRAF